MKIQEILKEAVCELNSKTIENPLLKARVLLAFTLNVEKEYLVSHSEEEISKEKIEEYRQYIDKLISNVPLQYITNHQEFMKLDFYVDESVLIPRQDTEILVEEVINICKQNNKSYDILDMCTGSGAIGISLAKYIQNSNVLLVDISKNALDIAKKNAKLNDVTNINFLKSNMFEQINKKFDIIVSNPPYIRKDIIKDLDEEVRKEPIIALDGGVDGLDFYRIIVDKAYNNLNPNGILFLEIGYDQKYAVIELLNKSEKYKNIYSKKDLSGNDRIIVAYAKKIEKKEV